MKSARFDWKNVKCLVTGAYGFVGTHLTRELIARGSKVVALDLLDDPRGTYFGLEGLDRQVETIQADVRAEEDLKALRGREFDCVFHLAAQPISPLSNLCPNDTMETNALGTRLLGHAVAHQVTPPRFIFASTACWYGASVRSPLSETDPGREGQYVYTRSKVEAEQEVMKLEAELGLPTVRCRFVNLYGEGDRHFSRIIPKSIRFLIEGETPRLTRDDGTTILDYLYVGDAVSALLRSAEHAIDFRGQVFNFGIAGDHPLNAIQLIRLVSQAFDGQTRDPIIENPVEPKTKMKFLDPTKARKKLAWQWTRRIDVGIRQTIEWYRSSAARVQHLQY